MGEPKKIETGSGYVLLTRPHKCNFPFVKPPKESGIESWEAGDIFHCNKCNKEYVLTETLSAMQQNASQQSYSTGPYWKKVEER